MQIQIENELNELLDHIDANESVPIAPDSIFAANVLSALWTFAAGKPIDRNDEQLIRLLQLIRARSTLFDTTGGFLNHMPFLRYLVPEKIGYNSIKRLNKEIHAFIMKSIAIHHSDYDDERANDDLIYAYITEMRKETNRQPNTFNDLQVSMTIVDIFMAAAVPATTILNLAVMTLVTYPEIQKRIHDEMDEVFPNGKTPSYSDRGLLPYTEAVLLEVQRFYSISPISLQRRALHETTLGGYTIPKNTTVLTLKKSVHMDKDYWGDPEVFRPERFLDENKTIIHTKRVMTFGQGRRKCIGEPLARSCLFTFFAGVGNRYKVVLPPGANIPDCDLLPGLHLSPKPYKVIFQKRL